MSTRTIPTAVGIVLMVIGGAVLLFALFTRSGEPGWIDVVAGVGIGMIAVGFRVFQDSRGQRDEGPE
jgi:steroid 5-alpha reductase family enzyme